ncbi:MAG: cytochrome c oxidase subunit II [Chloroflexota bacterium]|nr:cytochrome c oxidase subunit II [Chloroflexota bacterium]
MPKSATDKRHFIIVGVLIAISTVFLNWLLNAVLPLGVKASVEALTIDRLIGWHLLIIAFLFSLVVVFMIYAIVVFRHKENDDATGLHFEGNTSLEIAWTVLPLVLVVIFTYIGLRDLNEITKVEENELVVTALGQQWNWSFTYPNDTLSAELVLPVDQPILMKLEAKDVNHAFWVPEFRVKQDAVVGMTTEVRFTPSMTSAEYMAAEGREFKLVCAELCGLSHWSMIAPVRIVEQDEYVAWLDEQLAKANPAAISKTN